MTTQITIPVSAWSDNPVHGGTFTMATFTLTGAVVGGCAVASPGAGGDFDGLDLGIGYLQCNHANECTIALFNPQDSGTSTEIVSPIVFSVSLR